MNEVSESDFQVLKLVFVIVALVGVWFSGIGVTVFDSELHQRRHRLEAVAVLGRSGEHKVCHPRLLMGQALARDAGNL